MPKTSTKRTVKTRRTVKTKRTVKTRRETGRAKAQEDLELVGSLGPSSKQSLYSSKVESPELAEIVNLTSELNAREAVQQLEHQFAEAATRDDQVHVLRATQLAANRAQQMSENPRLKPATRTEKAQVAQVYEAASEVMEARLKMTSTRPSASSKGSSSKGPTLKKQQPRPKSFTPQYTNSNGLDLVVQPRNVIDYTQKDKIVYKRDGKGKIEEKAFDRVWIVEKEDTAKQVQEAFPHDVVHVLGGNPFDQPKTSTFSKNNRVRTSKDSTIPWRNDRSFGKYFYYPKVKKDQKVIVVTDEDYLGQYINREVTRAIASNSVQQFAIEGMKAEEFQKLLTSSSLQKEAQFSDAKAYAQEFFVEADSTINTTMISNMLSTNSFFVKYHEGVIKDAYGGDVALFKRAANLSQNTSLGRIELGLGGYILEKQLAQDNRVEISMDTELGIQTIEASITKPPRGDYNIKFETVDEEDLKILSTDETIQFLIANLNISGAQAEELISRLYRQGYLSYPRTESNHINLRKEEMKPQDLAQVWNAYQKNAFDEADIIHGIQELNVAKGKSGIIVLKQAPYAESDLEYQVLQYIAQLNVLATTKARKLTGRFVLEDSKGEIARTSEVSLLNTSEFGEDVGKVIDLKLLSDQGVSETELYSFLRKNGIGTPSTRTSKIEAMLNAGLLIKKKDRYLVDERLKFFIVENQVRSKYAQSRYSSTPGFGVDLTSALIRLRDEVEFSSVPQRYENAYVEVQKWLHAQYDSYDPELEAQMLAEIRQTLSVAKEQTSIDQELDKLLDDQVEVD